MGQARLANIRASYVVTELAMDVVAPSLQSFKGTVLKSALVVEPRNPRMLLHVR